jgi:Ca2+-binding EF-hand superfamily protein
MRVARKLGRLSLEVELMFGIFSRGSKSCTREDFKYCCLQRLNLKNDISERELDMLLDSKLKNRPNMEQRDFVVIFSDAINTARNEALNQESLDRQLLMRYNATIHNRDPMDGRTSGMTHSRSQDADKFMDFARKDAV